MDLVLPPENPVNARGKCGDITRAVGLGFATIGWPCHLRLARHHLPTRRPSSAPVAVRWISSASGQARNPMRITVSCILSWPWKIRGDTPKGSLEISWKVVKVLSIWNSAASRFYRRARAHQPPPYISTRGRRATSPRKYQRQRLAQRRQRPAGLPQQSAGAPRQRSSKSSPNASRSSDCPHAVLAISSSSPRSLDQALFTRRLGPTPCPWTCWSALDADLRTHSTDPQQI